MELAEDIKAKVLAKIEKLRLKLREMEIDHKSAWEMYESELCSLEMSDNESSLRAEIGLLNDYLNGKVDIVEDEKRFFAEINDLSIRQVELDSQKRKLSSILLLIAKAKEGIFD